MRKPMPAHTPEQALEHARRDLETALRQGGDTAQARNRLDEAEAALAQHQRNQRRQTAQARQETARRIEDETTTMVDEVRASILAELDNILPDFDVLVTIDTNAARWLAEARTAESETREAFNAIIEECGTVEARIAELETERAEIVARRHQRNPEDIGRLGMCDMDLQDLRAMLGRLRASLDALPHQDIPDLARKWQEAIRLARANARLVVAAELERRLLALAETLKAEAGAVGNIRLRYRPGLALATACRVGVV